MSEHENYDVANSSVSESGESSEDYSSVPHDEDEDDRIASDDEYSEEDGSLVTSEDEGSYYVRPRHLKKAVENGDIGLLSDVISGKGEVGGSTMFDVNDTLDDPYGYTLLHLAAQSGNCAVTQMLIDAKAFLNIKGFEDDTPLDCAFGQIPVMKTLIAARADLKLHDDNGRTPLECSFNHSTSSRSAKLVRAAALIREFDVARDGNAETVQRLVSWQGSLEWKTELGRIPLMEAVLADNASAVKVLIDAKAAVTMRDARRKTPLHHVAMYNLSSLVQILVDSKAGITVRDSDNNTPLMCALQRGNIATVKALAEVVDADGNTAVGRAVEAGDVALLRQLVAAQACLDVRNHAGYTPLMLAAMRGDVDASRCLIDAKASVLLQSSDGKSALDLALPTGSSAIVSVFGCHEAILQMAVSRGLSMLQQLIAAKVSLDVRNERGETPLILAAAQGLFDAVQTLIDAKAMVDAQDNAGRTACQWALWNRYDDTGKILANTINPYRDTSVNAGCCQSI